MTGLILRLGPKERVLINGAVIENGERRNRLSILSPGVHILRLRDALHPNEATTPVRRVCYAAQLVISGDVALDEAKPQVLRAIEQLSQILQDPHSRNALDQATQAVMAGQAYQALRALRLLIPREDAILGSAPA